ncbi:MAG: hypothetical protein ACTSRI_14540 [Promethearchaeota archaeon]
MARWQDVGNYSFTWQEIVNWFLNLPRPGQILIIIGIVALIVLTCVGVYYLIKGIAYLIYYLLKGVFYLLKGIALGLYKLFEGIYYLISGKPRKQKQAPVSKSSNLKEQDTTIRKTIEAYQPEAYYFCTECGTKFSDKMIYRLSTDGIVFCEYCGKGFTFGEKIINTLKTT